MSPPDPRWAEDFAREARRLGEALAPLAVTFHHIGSTAIAGIHAKPIIDLLLVVPSLRALDDRSPAAIEALGYEAKGEFGIPGRRYFRRDDASGLRTHQVHAFVDGDPGIARHRAFRDYLNAHPRIATAYSDLKRALAAAHRDDPAAYMDGKDSFIKEHETRALEWAAGASTSRAGSTEHGAAASTNRSQRADFA